MQCCWGCKSYLWVLKYQGLPYSIVFVGVNGVGKSTNLAKVCAWLLQNNLSVRIAACDTFRSIYRFSFCLLTAHTNAHSCPNKRAHALFTPLPLVPQLLAFGLISCSCSTLVGFLSCWRLGQSPPFDRFLNARYCLCMFSCFFKCEITYNTPCVSEKHFCCM